MDSGVWSGFETRIALSSIVGVEDVALIDMLRRINPKAQFFTLMTRIASAHRNIHAHERGSGVRYDLNLAVMYPDMVRVAPMVEEHWLQPQFYQAMC